MFSCGICKTFKNTYFEKHLQKTTSERNRKDVYIGYLIAYKTLPEYLRWLLLFFGMNKLKIL